LVSALFHYGAFGARDVAMTAHALLGYGVGLLGLIAIKVLAPAYFADMDTRTPVRIAIMVLITTQLLNVVLVPIWAHAGLALSISLGAWLNAAWLLYGLRRRGLTDPAPAGGGLCCAWSLPACCWVPDCSGRPNPGIGWRARHSLCNEFCGFLAS